MTNPIKLIKLYFTERDYYEQRKRYMKLQKKYRKELKKQAKEFCPWSGYYMHKMITTMLEFYFKTYEAHDCCWSESAWNDTVAESLKRALDVAEELDRLDDLEYAELTDVAKKDGKAFEDYLKQYPKVKRVLTCSAVMVAVKEPSGCFSHSTSTVLPVVL